MQVRTALAICEFGHRHQVCSVTIDTSCALNSVTNISLAGMGAPCYDHMGVQRTSGRGSGISEALFGEAAAWLLA